jgi:hypothetical protein
MPAKQLKLIKLKRSHYLFIKPMKLIDKNGLDPHNPHP